MVQGLVRLTLLAVLLLSGCAVTPPAEKAEPVTADTELQGVSGDGAAEPRRAGPRPGRDRRGQPLPGTGADHGAQLLVAVPRAGAAAAGRGRWPCRRSFAQRALRLAPDNDDYRAELWELVAAARAEQGDRSGADEARARAQALRQPDRA